MHWGEKLLFQQQKTTKLNLRDLLFFADEFKIVLNKKDNIIIFRFFYIKKTF